ncbi:MAG TPA: homoserine O-acetyltransferase [Candidatus Sumerlaeota bacterium]|nr:MAG: Homoserine O-acetyltransferase [candidate division BRC1 bacterium ADurb.BinA292]HOE94966.1 homoserine O-acetyltransferase [Candidatus Sumerlaeota bacterium]
MRALPTVETQFFTFAKSPEDAFVLESGDRFGPITLAYETWGELNADRSNAILLFHALTGSQHAAGFNPAVQGCEDLWTEECQIGWWNDFIGPGCALDTDRYFVICINYLGGCYGSTGPRSINPATGRPYGGAFPTVTVRDTVDAQMRLLDHLGIQCLLAAVGGSLGGMMVLELATRYPERVRCVIPLAAGHHATTLQRLHNFEAIFAIEEDRNYNYGDYYDGDPPRMGLMLARMIAHKTFVHVDVMEERARGEIVQAEDDLKGYRLRHQIESYMLHQGKKFVQRFDANAYLRILYMWQNFDLRARFNGDAVEAFKPCRHQRYLVFSIDSDVCFWPEEQEELCQALKMADVPYQHITVHSDKGHDSFLLEPRFYAPYLSYVLDETWREIQAGQAAGDRAK